MIRAVSHLIDDASFGGVNRMLDHMSSSEALQRHHQHRIVRVRRGQFSSPVVTADVIVSHLSVNWANLPMLTALRAAYPDTPIIHVEHSYSQRFVAARVDNKDRFDTLLRTAYALFDTVVAVSEAQYRWMRRRQFCPVDKLTAIRSCADLAPFFEVGPVAPRERMVIGAIGRFDVQKGFDVLLEGFLAAQRDDIELHFHGDGPEAEKLASMARTHRNVVFHGYSADTSAAVAECDAVAMPSRWEPYGLVALEAMAAGRAVLCPRIDGLADHIEAGAIEIGDNGVEGWKAYFETVDRRDIAAKGLRGRAVAQDAALRFVGAWTELLIDALDSERDLALAA